jgi:hypothetical protein
MAKTLETRRFGAFQGVAMPAGKALLVACLLAVAGSGCALSLGKEGASVVKTCVLPTDQRATLAGKWKITPIPIAFHQGDFSSDEITQMTTAADTWNAFFAASQGISQVLDYGASGNVRLSTQPVPTDACTIGLLQGNTFTGNVVVYKQATWPHTGASSTMALTSFCTRSATPVPAMYMAYMELNYQGFFREGLKQPDIQTIITHEFGHLLGLFHSCDKGSTTTGKPNCDSSGLDPAYQAAVMFPTFGFNSDLSGERKRELKDNDQGRANCLYTATDAAKEGT